MLTFLSKVLVHTCFREKTSKYYMEFGNDVEIPEHSHDSQWGVVLAGYKDVTLFNQRDRYKISEHQNR
jgi:hypothetical protein